MDNPAVILRIGLHPTPLTRALSRGDFVAAERLILDTWDTDYLNEGALDCTPLSLVLGGGSVEPPRNLKLARLLLERGACPNLRIPAPDMETASESPLELLLRYYLQLIHMFGVPGNPGFRTTTRPVGDEIDLLNVVGINGELFGLGPEIIAAQTRELVMYCLERGGDPNLPSTDAAKTIYHLALTAPTVDEGLLLRMLELGANLNHADVHNTTPLMDLVSLGDEERVLSELARLQRSGRNLLLDSQNCSLQSVLWRAVFQGHIRLASALLSGAGNAAIAALSARVEPAANRPPVQHLPRLPAMATDLQILPLLSPFLADSPCGAALHANVLKRKHEDGGSSVMSSRRSNAKRGTSSYVEFSVSRSDHVALSSVAPLVDSGLMEDRGDCHEVGSQLMDLVKLATEHGHVGELDLADAVDVGAIAPLMFGQVSAGLRQLAARAILRHALFPAWRSPERTVSLLNEICERRGFTTFRLLVPPSYVSVSNGMLAHDYILELGHEVEVSISQEGETSQPPPREEEDSFHQHQELIHQEVVAGAASAERPEERAEEYSAQPGEEAQATGPLALDGGVGTEEFWNGLERLDREAWGLQTDSFLASLDRESAELERRFWRLALEVMSGQRLEDASAEERRQANNFWDLKQRRINQLRERMREQFSEIENHQKVLDSINKELQQLDEEENEEVRGKSKVEAELEGEDQCHLEPLLGDPDQQDQAVPDQAKLPSVSEYDAVRKQLDENWSLGPGRNMSSDPKQDLPYVVPLSYSHTEKLVQSLDVSVNMAPTPQPRLVARRNGRTASPVPLVPLAQPRELLHGEGYFNQEVLVEGGLGWVDGSYGELPQHNLPSRPRSDSLRHLRGSAVSPEGEHVLLSNEQEHVVLPSEQGHVVLSTEQEHVVPSTEHYLVVAPADWTLPYSRHIPHITAGPEVGISSHEEEEDHLFLDLFHERSSQEDSPRSRGREVLSSSSSSSLSDSGSWGGPFSLRHVTGCRDSIQDVPINEGTVISRLNSRVLDALTDDLGIPVSLRVCFALEAARLQLTLLLSTRQSIACDRNCQGNESDGDSEDEWADSISDLDDHSDIFQDANLSGSTSSLSTISDGPLSSASSVHSGASTVSIFGSSQGGGAAIAGAASPLPAWASSTPTTDLSPTSTRRSSEFEAIVELRSPSSLANFPPLSRPQSSQSSSSSSSIFGLSGAAASPTWLSDREDLCRLRHFLSGPTPAGWQDSTSSEEEADNHI